jgi:hypothetical protein
MVANLTISRVDGKEYSKRKLVEKLGERAKI